VDALQTSDSPRSLRKALLWPGMTNTTLTFNPMRRIFFHLISAVSSPWPLILPHAAEPTLPRPLLHGLEGFAYPTLSACAAVNNDGGALRMAYMTRAGSSRRPSLWCCSMAQFPPRSTGLRDQDAEHAGYRVVILSSTNRQINNNKTNTRSIKR